MFELHRLRMSQNATGHGVPTKRRARRGDRLQVDRPGPARDDRYRAIAQTKRDVRRVELRRGRRRRGVARPADRGRRVDLRRDLAAGRFDLEAVGAIGETVAATGAADDVRRALTAEREPRVERLGGAGLYEREGIGVRNARMVQEWREDDLRGNRSDPEVLHDDRAVGAWLPYGLDRVRAVHRLAAYGDPVGRE